MDICENLSFDRATESGESIVSIAAVLQQIVANLPSFDIRPWRLTGSLLGKEAHKPEVQQSRALLRYHPSSNASCFPGIDPRN